MAPRGRDEYKGRQLQKIVDRVSRNDSKLSGYGGDPGLIASTAPGRGATGNIIPDRLSMNVSPDPHRRIQSGFVPNKIRTQAQNYASNTPGQNRKVNLERELYEDFLVQYGLVRQEETGLVDSPEGRFRRAQLHQYIDKHRDRPEFKFDQAYEYGGQIGARFNQERGRKHHEARFP